LAKYDVVVVGAGAAGLSAAGLLAKSGKNVLVVEKQPWLGGRAMMVSEEGFRVQLGGHLIEDTGSGLGRIFEYLGVDLKEGPVSTDMPVWDHESERWGSIRDRYSGSRAELKRVISAIVATPYEDLDEWDDRPLRAWLAGHTDDAGVVELFEFLAVLECMTDVWWDHSASDNLYVRKLHYGEKQVGGYSFWPEGGWDRMWQDLADAVVAHGGEIRTGVPVSRVAIADGEVEGILVGSDAAPEDEFIETPCVISTLPVWDVLDVVPEDALPDWYAGQIRYLAQDRFRVAWLGQYLATREPVPVIDRLELSTWLRGPLTGTTGFLFEQTAMDPTTAPEGIHLYVMGGIIPGSRGRDDAYVADMFERFQREMEIMYPGFADPVWRRHHLVFEPAFGVIQKPGLVGRYRPHWRAPNVDGLYFASETFRSRMIGTDRAARAGLTVAEDYLGRRLWPLEAGWRY